MLKMKCQQSTNLEHYNEHFYLAQVRLLSGQRQLNQVLVGPGIRTCDPKPFTDISFCMYDSPCEFFTIRENVKRLSPKVGSDLRHADSHVIKPHEYKELPELTMPALKTFTLSSGATRH